MLAFPHLPEAPRPFRVAAATIASKSRWALARATAKSFLEHNPGIPFYALLADEDEGLIDPDREPFSIIRLDQLGLPEKDRFCFQYSEMELSYALTPYLIEYLLNNGFDGALFLKQETMVLDGLGPIWEKLREHPVVVTPHLLEPGIGDEALAWEINVLRAGIFNGGVVAFSGHDEGREFLSWWKEMTSRECFLAIEKGLHYEQRWLDFVPTFVPSCHVLRDPGINVGHWNLFQRRVAVSPDGRVTACGVSCRIFRFSGYEPDNPERSSKYNVAVTMDRAGAAAQMFERYRSLLIEGGYETSRRWPYAYGHFDNGVRVADITRRIYHDWPGSVERFGNPFSTASAESFYRWLNAPAEEGNLPGVTNFWNSVYRRRPDLLSKFGDLSSDNRGRFETWIRTTGIKEYGVMEP